MCVITSGVDLNFVLKIELSIAMGWKGGRKKRWDYLAIWKQALLSHNKLSKCGPHESIIKDEYEYFLWIDRLAIFDPLVMFSSKVFFPIFAIVLKYST